jgi:hypothetical protein
VDAVDDKLRSAPEVVAVSFDDEVSLSRDPPLAITEVVCATLIAAPVVIAFAKIDVAIPVVAALKTANAVPAVDAVEEITVPNPVWFPVTVSKYAPEAKFPAEAEVADTKVDVTVVDELLIVSRRVKLAAPGALMLRNTPVLPAAFIDGAAIVTRLPVNAVGAPVFRTSRRDPVLAAAVVSADDVDPILTVDPVVCPEWDTLIALPATAEVAPFSKEVVFAAPESVNLKLPPVTPALPVASVLSNRTRYEASEVMAPVD